MYYSILNSKVEGQKQQYTVIIGKKTSNNFICHTFFISKSPIAKEWAVFPVKNKQIDYSNADLTHLDYNLKLKDIIKITHSCL